MLKSAPKFHRLLQCPYLVLPPLCNASCNLSKFCFLNCSTRKQIRLLMGFAEGHDSLKTGNRDQQPAHHTACLERYYVRSQKQIFQIQIIVFNRHYLPQREIVEQSSVQVEIGKGWKPCMVKDSRILKQD